MDTLTPTPSCEADADHWQRMRAAVRSAPRTGCPAQRRRGQPADGWHGRTPRWIAEDGQDDQGHHPQRLTAGEGTLKVAKTLGVGVSTVQRVKAEMLAAPVG